MRKINYQYQKKKEDFLNEYYNCISLNINNEKDICDEIIKFEDYETWNFKKLVTASFNELIDFTKKIENLNSEDLNKFFKWEKSGKTEYLYTNLQRTIANFFIEQKINIKSCFYCNIEFINPFNQFIEYNSIDDFFKMATEDEWKELISEKKGIEIYNHIRLNPHHKTKDLKANIKGIGDKTINEITLKNINKLKKFKDHFTLDHLIPKGKYPSLSISLFNLIPSCYSCNSKFKTTKVFDNLDTLHKISPSSESFNLDESLEFKINFDIDNYFKNGNKNLDLIDIKLTNLTSEKDVDKFIDMFNLKGRYEFHKNISLDLLEKRKMYSDSQLDEIEKIFLHNNIKIEKETLKKQIFGSVIIEKENTNEPFEKYKKDIAKQLGLI